MGQIGTKPNVFEKSLIINHCIDSWNYFFNWDESLDQQQFIKHYFLDLLFFIFLICASIFLVIFYTPSSIPLVKLINIDSFVSSFILTVDVVLCLSMLYLNRISIVTRRLNYLGLNRIYILVALIPVVSIVFEFFLMFAPLEKMQLDNLDNDDLYFV